MKHKGNIGAVDFLVSSGSWLIIGFWTQGGTEINRSRCTHSGRSRLLDFAPPSIFVFSIIRNQTWRRLIPTSSSLFFSFLLSNFNLWVDINLCNNSLESLAKGENCLIVIDEWEIPREMMERKKWKKRKWWAESGSTRNHHSSWYTSV